MQETCPSDTQAESSRVDTRRSRLKRVLGFISVALGSIALANAVVSLRTPRLDNRLGGAFNRYPSRHGDLAYTVAGSGPPILLLHSLEPGNSMAEWSLNFDLLADNRTVYALDFLGWGLSDKSRERYSPLAYAEQVQHFAEDIIQEPCAVIASGLGCAFAVLAADRYPPGFNKLVLVCPRDAAAFSLTGGAITEAMATRLLRLPVLGTALYHGATRSAHLQRLAARHLFFNKEQVTEHAARYTAAARQPGALAAYASLPLPGELDWRTAWSRLAIPALLVWGRNALTGGLDAAPDLLSLKPDAALEVLDEAMLLPHVEHPQRFTDLVEQWLETAA